MTVPLVLSISVEQVTFCISPLGTFWKFSTSAITSRFPLRSAKEGEGEWTQSVHLFCFHIYILILALCYCFFNFSVTASANSSTELSFSVQDSTLSQTLPACLMAMSGPCTLSTGERWRTAACISVCCSWDALSSLFYVGACLSDQGPSSLFAHIFILTVIFEFLFLYI